MSHTASVTSHAQVSPSSGLRVHRIEVWPRSQSLDARGASVARSAGAIGVSLSSVSSARVYLLETDADAAQVALVAQKLLADPVTERAVITAAPVAKNAFQVEVHPLPGVMDPAAQSVEVAAEELFHRKRRVRVSTGIRYDLFDLSGGKAHAELLARRTLFNPAIQAAHFDAYLPKALPSGHEYVAKVARIAIRDLNDDQLQKMSREAHLFLSLDEMRAVRDEYRTLGRDPTDVELETIAQTWSEHCVHKTLKSNIKYKAAAGTTDPLGFAGRPGHTVHADGSVTIANLLKSTVAAATHELIADGIDWTLSVFKDNSGVIAFDDAYGVCIKVETHNHPSAIEPYGGSATGIGGCIRDVIGTGLGAKPIASTDVFCVAMPSESSLPPGCLPPKRVLSEVVRGIRDYGNRMGIPTVSGAVSFDDRYIGNPLVFAGCIGLIPRTMVHGASKPGDRIIALGGRTGRDGIHGATFSSAEMEHTHADEFSHAVQIGNAIEEKRTLDAILRARDFTGGPLYHGMTDCGAGGFSSAVGEMGGKIGATVQLDRAPLKYAGLSYTEIWISEAQERMVLAVPAQNVAKLQKICDEEGVELADLGEFGTPGAELVLRHGDLEVGRLPMAFLHDGIPTPTREAEWTPSTPTVRPASKQPNLSISSSLLSLLSHPNIASKHWIIRQYDHEVQGNSIVKPLGGPLTRGPMDAAVLQPIPSTRRGIAISCGLQTGLGNPEIGGDPYLMTLAAIDECVRNLVCVGADPTRIAILDNFCWPSCSEARNLGTLVRAAEACYDGAKAYRTPFVSGKDSLNNQLRYTDPVSGEQKLIEIPPTLLITGLAIVSDVARCITMDAKSPGNVLLLVGETSSAMGGSHLQLIAPEMIADGSIPHTDLKSGPRTAHTVASVISSGLVRSAHDVSDGGLLCAVAEMLIAGSTAKKPVGASLKLEAAHADVIAAAFSESPSRYILEVAPENAKEVQAKLAAAGVSAQSIGTLDNSGRLKASGLDAGVEDLAKAWLAPLDW
ncbi:MAG: phosphoribosylformylglycinamidine synthase subunit PurS [Phycisphaerae bacterium]|nr:phosphoribosylformylglycinamidine synthase subunit PurS [Phycisphaerae bacterium]